MQLNLFITFLMAGLLTVVASSNIQRRSSFTIERVANPGFTGHNGPRALAKVYRKYRMPLPRDLVDALEFQDFQKRSLAAQQQQQRQQQQEGQELGSGDKSTEEKRDMMGDMGIRVSLAGTMQDGKMQKRGLLDVLTGKKQQGGKKAAKKAAKKAGGDRQGAQQTATQQTGQRAKPQGGQQPAGDRGQQQPAGQRGQQPQGGQQQQAPRLNQTSSFNQTDGAGRATSQSGTVVAVPEENDTEFLSPVDIGGQVVNLDFDTGSSDLWVFSTKLPAQSTANHRLYDSTKSQTFTEMPGSEFLIRYGDGSGAKGTVGMDVVSVGGVSVQQQPVQLATAVTGQFVKDQNNDGLMGLAFSKLNTVKPQKQMTFFDNVKATLAEPVFTADLRKNATGSYTFGSVDRSKFQGQLTSIPVNTTMGFWQFSSEKFAVAGGEQQAATPGGQAIADTGTTLILADAKIVEGYYQQVQGAQQNQQMGGITVPCNAKLPDLDLDIGGVYMARISGDNINFAPLGNGQCFGGLQAAPAGAMGIYGDIFFKSQFVVFDGGNNTLGMAPHA